MSDSPLTDSALDASYTYEEKLGEVTALCRDLEVKSPFAALMDDAMLELLDMANDGRALEIRFVPGKHGGESSFLMWKPIGGKGCEEMSLREHVPDADPPEVRQVWLLGSPVAELREFLAPNVSAHPCANTNQESKS